MRGGKLADIFALRPTRVLADRSRDAACGYAFARLSPRAIFQCTDNHGPLRAALLRDYDVLGICGNGALAYSPGELRAIEHFVRRGGTLILAACAGWYELYSGRPIESLAQNGVARLFGFSFESARDMTPNLDGVRGYAREDLEFTAAGARLGLSIGDLEMARPGPLSAPRGATVLMRSRSDGRPVMAMANVGRGKVLVFGDTDSLSDSNAFCAAHIVAMADPAGRVKAKSPPVDLIRGGQDEISKSGVVVRFGAGLRSRAELTMKLGIAIRDELVRLIRPETRFERWTIILERGCDSRSSWNFPDGRPETQVGAEMSDGAMVWHLTRWLGEFLLWRRISPVRTFLWQLRRALCVRMTRKLGYDPVADVMIAAWRRDPARLDLGRLYSETNAPGQARLFWIDAEAALGAKLVDRWFAQLPRKKAFEAFAPAVFSELDMTAAAMAQAVGARAYEWLEQQGHTVRRLRLPPLRSKQFAAGMRRALTRIMLDDQEDPSARFEAMLALGGEPAARKKDFDAAARRAQSAKPATALPAAAQLAMSKDVRGLEALRRWLKSPDRGLSGVVSLAVVLNFADAQAADVLSEFAAQAGARFKLAAGYALRLAGDARGKAFAFGQVDGCEVRMEYDGMVKAFATVDGYDVANVWCYPIVRPTQFGGGYSTYYVQWVHTSPGWRRRGLARMGMEAALKSHWDRDCAMTSLHTGTRNVAHALYRDFGLLDYHRGLRCEKLLGSERAARASDGVRVRPIDAKTRAAAMAFVDEQHAHRPVDPENERSFDCERLGFAAWRKGKIVAVAAGRAQGKGAQLDFAITTPIKDDHDKEIDGAAERAGLAVLSAVHREMRRRGASKVKWSFHQPRQGRELLWMLRRAGYGTSLNGGVELFRLNNLHQYLREVRPTLERRLADSKTHATWTGAITIATPRQQATLRIDRGRILVQGDLPEVGPATVLRGSGPAIQRMLMGVTSCYEEYLQIEVDARPLVNDGVRDLMEILWPKLIYE